jgi:2-methylcitrate dehydratase PrpD
VAGLLAGLTPEETRHAVGIAEFYGPRSQMMRLIDHPSMLKDSAGWGATAGASAVHLARAGFSGAPALIVEQTPDHRADLANGGSRWSSITNPNPFAAGRSPRSKACWPIVARMG